MSVCVYVSVRFQKNTVLAITYYTFCTYVDDVHAYVLCKEVLVYSFTLDWIYSNKTQIRFRSFQ